VLAAYENSEDLTVPEHVEIFVVGAPASLYQNGQAVARCCAVHSSGRYAAKVIHNRIAVASARFFSYFDKGSNGPSWAGILPYCRVENSHERFGAWLLGRPCTSSPGDVESPLDRLPPMDFGPLQLGKEVIS